MSAQPQPRPSPVPLRTRKPSRWRFYALSALAVLLVAGGAGWIYMRQESIVPVRVFSPTYQDIDSTVSSTGLVTPAQEFQARANFSGIVEKIYVHVGQKVRAGQMLFYLKDQYATSRLDSARAALKSDELALQRAEQNGTAEDHVGDSTNLAQAQQDRDTAAAALATVRQLEKRGSASEAEVLTSENQLKLANAALRTAQDRIKDRYSPAEIQSLKAKVRADEDSVAAERVSWSNAHVSTPISGTVYIVPVSQYDFVPAGKVLVDVSDLRQMEVRANFYEDDVGKLRVGEPATVQWDGAPGKTWSGKVISRPLAVQRTGSLPTGQCIIALTSPARDLPINSNVVVRVQSQSRPHVLAVPRTAIHGEGPGQFVYRVVNGRLRKTLVKTGLFDPMQIEIAGGITPRDVVALLSTNGKQLRDGLRVTTAQTH
ncbi:MAG TPA: efflux RND transporter periplasmic adaptor subunit [Terracidiphilus sp.]|nr:efflux RND transporter periplasmic adaptor subunit [Terracidiphilus sp.]